MKTKDTTSNNNKTTSPKVMAAGNKHSLQLNFSELWSHINFVSPFESESMCLLDFHSYSAGNQGESLSSVLFYAYLSVWEILLKKDKLRFPVP